MQNHDSQPLPADRRRWLATAGRWAALGGLGLLAGRLSMRRRSGICPAAFACGACAERPSCQLPQALAARKSRSE